MAGKLQKFGRSVKKLLPNACFVASIGIATFEISHWSPEGAGLFLAAILFFVGKGIK